MTQDHDVLNLQWVLRLTHFVRSVLNYPIFVLPLFFQMTFDYANPLAQPDLTFTEATPDEMMKHQGLPEELDAFGAPSVPERRASTTSLFPTRQPTSSMLRPNRQWSNLGNASIKSWTNSESAWAAAVNQAIQRDDDVVDKWQRSMDVHLIFVSDLVHTIRIT